MATNQPEVSSLKDFLALRGLKQTERKAELIARAFGAYELNAPKKFSQEQIYEKIREEYAKRLKSNLIETEPKALPDSAWADDVQQWPKIDDGKNVYPRSKNVYPLLVYYTPLNMQKIMVFPHLY